MKKIYKYELSTDDWQETLHLPIGAQIIHIAGQNNAYGRGIYMWAIIPNANTKTEERTIKCFGTGHPIPENAIYLGTVHDIPFVWHYFELEK